MVRTWWAAFCILALCALQIHALCCCVPTASSAGPVPSCMAVFGYLEGLAEGMRAKSVKFFPCPTPCKVTLLQIAAPLKTQEPNETLSPAVLWLLSLRTFRCKDGKAIATALLVVPLPTCTFVNIPSPGHPVLSMPSVFYWESD